MLLWASHFCDFCHVLCEQSRLKQEDENWVSSCQLLEVKGSLLRRESEEGLKQGLPSLVSELLCCERAVRFVVAHRTTCKENNFINLILLVRSPFC